MVAALPLLLAFAQLLTSGHALSLASGRPAARHCASPVLSQRRVPVVVARDPTQSQRLREEIEDPFAKARLFVWPVFFAAAGISSFFAITTLLAEAAGARPAADGSAVNLAIDLAAMVAVGFGWRNELGARQKRLRRITAGAAMASLQVQLLRKEGRRSVKLADLRAGRGAFDEEEGTRVVIVAAERAALEAALASASERSDALVSADLLLVPVLVDSSGAQPRAAAPPPELITAESLEHLGLPQGMPQWQEVIESELETAIAQDESAPSRGLTLVLKKNGRVGTRRLGCPDWNVMLADVDARKSAGLDTRNI